jgi:hypothetical protein
MTIIRDPRNGDGAHIDRKFRLFVNAEASSLQHIISEEDEEAFQVEGETAWSAASGAENVLHIKNTSTIKNLVVTYIRLQAITDLTVPAIGTYFTLETGETYASGGSAVTPVNMNVGSSRPATATAYEGNPTLAGSSTQFDKWFLAINGGTQIFNKEADLIVGPTKTMKVLFTPAGSHTGTAYARISFVMLEPDL